LGSNISTRRRKSSPVRGEKKSCKSSNPVNPDSDKGSAPRALITIGGKIIKFIVQTKCPQSALKPHPKIDPFVTSNYSATIGLKKNDCPCKRLFIRIFWLSMGTITKFIVLQERLSAVNAWDL
jgi:hypothetical protein